MAHSLRPSLVALALLATAGTAPLLAQPAAQPIVEHDDCEANFIAAVGADAYQFSPEHRGELGSVRLFSVLSYQEAAARGETGRAFWRLQIRSPRRLVYEERGVVPLADATGKALVERTCSRQKARPHCCRAAASW